MGQGRGQPTNLILEAFELFLASLPITLSFSKRTTFITEESLLCLLGETSFSVDFTNKISKDSVAMELSLVPLCFTGRKTFKEWI